MRTGYVALIVTTRQVMNLYYIIWLEIANWTPSAWHFSPVWGNFSVAPAGLRPKPRQRGHNPPSPHPPARHLYPDRPPKGWKSYPDPQLQGTPVPGGPSSAWRQSWVLWVQVWPDRCNLWTSCLVARGAQLAMMHLEVWVEVWHIVSYHVLVQAEQQPWLTFSQRFSVMASNLKPAELIDSQDKGGWTLLSALSRVKNLPLTPEVPLHNRYEALGLEEGKCVNNNVGQDPQKCRPT